MEGRLKSSTFVFEWFFAQNDENPAMIRQ